MPAYEFCIPTVGKAVPTGAEWFHDEYKAGLEAAISRGWLVLHESGTYVKFTPAGAELFA